MPYESGKHASEEVLEEYALGHLSERETDEFEEHLLVCHSCQDRLQETDRFIRAFRSAARYLEATRRPSSAAGSWRSIRALRRPAPALLLAAGVLAVVVGWRALSPARHPAAAVPVKLEAQRGTPARGAPAGEPLAISLDAFGLAELPSYAVEIVDASGAPVVKTAAKRSGDRILLEGARKFTSGTYWVRVYGSSRELLREYGLRVSENTPR